VPDLSADGFPLLGGRLDRLGNRAVAALVYARRKHVIDLYAWSGEPRMTENTTTRDGYNVVIHEMAHKLDGRDGVYDGCPPLHRGMDFDAWRDAFRASYESLRSSLERPAPRRGRGSRAKRGPRIDSYAAASPDEFFAVACEYFYERPALLRSEYPEVYRQLTLFFRRDPTED